MKIYAALVLAVCSCTVQKEAPLQIAFEGLCLIGPKKAVVVQNGPDFIIADLTWDVGVSRVYIGNFPQVPQGYEFPKEKTFTVIIKNEAWVHYDRDFPQYIHAFDIKKKDLFNKITEMKITDKCTAEYLAKQHE